MTKVVVITVDDIGLEQFSLHGAGGGGSVAYPATPNINGVAAAGVRFNFFCVPPSCSPARACWLTGRYGDRTGIGNPVESRLLVGELFYEPALNISEITLPKLLRLAGKNVHTALIGKDHICQGSNNVGRDAPGKQGFDYWMGQERNLGGDDLEVANTDYYEWRKRGVEQAPITTVFNTIDITNEAVAYIKERQAIGGDYFCLINYNASHTPLNPNNNQPPTDLYNSAAWPTGWGDPPLTNNRNFKAHTEAVDTEIGRIIAAIDFTDTTLFVTSDNGTAAPLLDETHPDKGAYDSSGWGENQGKGTQYDPGIRVPLYVQGVGVTDTGRTHDGYWHAVDLFSTWADMFGVDASAFLSDTTKPRRPIRVIDGESFKAVLDNTSSDGRENPLVFANYSPIGANALTTAGRRAVIYVNSSGTRYKLMTWGAYPLFEGDGPYSVGQRLFNLTQLDADDEFELQGPDADTNPADLLLNGADPSVLGTTDREAYDACLAVLADLAQSVTDNDLQFIATEAQLP